MPHSKYKNLVIIGNGFDRWQNLPTSYDEFRQYYLSHVDEVMADLGIQRHRFTDNEGNKRTVIAVELIYGDPFHPENLPDEFFWNFETMLDKLDDQQINLYFGRSKKGIDHLKELVTEAQKILHTLFCSWVMSLDISEAGNSFRFPGDCYFINFNYTDTLEKRFGVEAEDDYHIHGSAVDADSIIVGHSSHPETAFEELIDHKFIRSVKSGRLPRLEGLYRIEEVLYLTDKHVEDNIDRLCMEMMKRGVHIEDFENIYVLGHSFGEPDLKYFEYLDKVTRCGCDYDRLSAAERLDKGLLMLITYGGEAGEDILLDQINLNIQYAAHHRDRVFPDAPSLYPELDKLDEENGITYSAEDAAYAVKQRFLYEQAGRTQKLLKELAKKNGLTAVPEGCHSVLSLANYLYGHDRRCKNANWHISCFTEADKKRAKRVMKMLGQKRYTLYSGIDECIEVLLGKR